MLACISSSSCKSFLKLAFGPLAQNPILHDLVLLPKPYVHDIICTYMEIDRRALCLTEETFNKSEKSPHDFNLRFFIDRVLPPNRTEFMHGSIGAHEVKMFQARFEPSFAVCPSVQVDPRSSAPLNLLLRTIDRRFFSDDSVEQRSLWSEDVSEKERRKNISRPSQLEEG